MFKLHGPAENMMGVVTFASGLQGARFEGSQGHGRGIQRLQYSTDIPSLGKPRTMGVGETTFSSRPKLIAVVETSKLTYLFPSAACPSITYISPQD